VSTIDLDVLDERVGETTIEQRLRVPPGLGCLEGHFPGFPVLPGIAQLHWAVAAGSRLAGRPLRPSRIEALKFRRMIRPGEEFSAAVELVREGRLLRVRFERDGRPVASGRLLLGEPEDSLGSVDSPGAIDESSPCEALVPQSGAMLFLDRLLATDEKRTVCRIRIDDLPFFREPDGSLPGWAGVEPMAQCIAAHGGIHAPKPAGGGPRVGFLLGCRRLEIRAHRLSPGVGYAVSAARVWGGETGLVSFDCDLFEMETGRRLLAGRINAYLPEDLTEIMEGRLG
jgi:3-hydroxyacyl-[acyl-carrier-protein] dehydratase